MIDTLRLDPLNRGIRMLRLIAAALVGLTTMPALAEPSCGHLFLGTPPGLEVVSGFARAGDIGYTTSSEGLVVMHRVDGGPPEVHHVVPFPLLIDVTIDGDQLYTLGANGLVMVYDVSDPLKPDAIGQTSIPGNPQRLKVAHGVMAARTLDGVRIVDVTDPTAPAWATLIDDGAGGPFALGDGVLVSNFRFNDVTVLDISNPAAPVEIGLIELAARPGDLAVSGDVLFTASYDGMSSFDISSPANPVLLGTLPGYHMKIQIDDDELYVWANGSVLRLDASDPANLRALAGIRCAGDQFNFGWGGYAVTSNWLTSMWDMHAAPTMPVGKTPAPVSLVNLIEHNGAAYALTDDGIGVVTIDDQASPIWVSHTDLGHAIIDGTVADGHLFVVADEGGLFVLDVADPQSPVLVGNLDTGVPMKGVEVSGGLAFIAAEWHFQILDVTNPASPRLLATRELQTPGHVPWAADVLVRGTLVYVADRYTGVRPFDVSDPANPVELPTMDLPSWGFNHVHLFQQRGVVTTGASIIYVDATSPTSFHAIDYQLVSGGTRDIIRTGDSVIVTSSSIVQMIDVSDPHAMRFERTIMPPVSTDGSGWGTLFRATVVVDGWLLVAASDELLVFDPTPCGVCIGDLTRDGTLNVDDVEAFVAAYLGGSIAADLDGDGSITLDDLGDFVAAFLGGCPSRDFL